MRKPSRWVVSATCFVFLGCAMGGTVSAASLTSFASVFPGFFSPDSAVLDGDFGRPSASAALTSNFGDSTFAGSASATAAFGELTATASVSLTNYDPFSFTSGSPPTGTAAAGTDGGFVDTVTVSGGLGDAFLTFDFDVTGSASSSTGRVPAATLDIWNAPVGMDGGAFFANGIIVQSVAFRQPGQISLTTPVTFGVPLNLAVTLFTAVGPAGFAPSPDQGAVPYDYTAVADWGNTARLAGVSVFTDPDLTDPIHNFGLSAESGTDYLGLVAVPEPSTVLLLAMGVGLIRLRQRRGANGL